MASQVAASARSCGPAAAGVGVWLGVVAAEDPEIGDRCPGSGPSALPLSLFLFLHPVGIRFGDAFLRGCSFLLVFPPTPAP